MSQYYCRKFLCPVAGAASAVLDSVSACSEISGEWPSSPLPAEAKPFLPAVDEVAFEVMRAMLRELPRRWLVDALMLYGDLAGAGRFSGRWEPDPGPVFTENSLALDGAFGAWSLTSVTDGDILEAKAYADSWCKKSSTTR